MSAGARRRAAALALLGHAVAYAPVWHWYLARMSDGSDEPGGLIALAAAIALLARAAAPSATAAAAPPGLAAPALITLVYAVSFAWLLPLGRALLAVLSLAASARALRPGGLGAGGTGLLVLSLPVVATVQFYAGYPLRLAVAALAAPLLGAQGLPVVADGIALRQGDLLVAVDAPCSGVRMLWAALFVACALAAARRLAPLATAAAAALAVVAAIAGNAVRAAALFQVETAPTAAPAWLHDGVGLVAFALVAMTVAAATAAVARAAPAVPAAAAAGGGPRPGARSWSLPFAAACLLAACVPVGAGRAATRTGSGTPSGTGSVSSPAWPERLDGEKLEPLPLAAREERWAVDFPGRIGRFRTGTGEVLLRQVESPTRRLHPAADCLRGSGYRVEPLAGRRDAGGSWGCFSARRGGERLRVCEQVRDADGKSFSDVSAWFWAAFLGRSRGPWLAITRAETLPEGDAAGPGR